jgi:Mrp family chromosome partitioning ATPase
LLERIARVLSERGLKVLVVNADSLTTSRHLLPDIMGKQEVARIGGSVSSYPSLSISGNQNRLPLGSELNSAMDALSKPYDLVLISSPALNASADTELLVCVTDATILAVEAGEVKRKTLERTARWLERLKAPSVGVIMTHVKLKSGGIPLRRAFAEFQGSRATPKTSAVLKGMMAD